jgi:hemolysin III
MTAPADDRLVRQSPETDPAADLPNVPLLDEAIDYDRVERKPTWRGWIHAGTAPVALILGILLVALADGTAAKVSSAIFAASSLLLFGISATYHRFDWSPKMKRALKRFDHANIFLLIAGTYTPLAVIALPQSQAVLLLSLVWGGALLGIGFRIFWVGAPRWLYVPLYVLLGWAAMMYVVDLLAASVAMMVLVMVGGVLYTLGAVAYGFKRPNPIPGVFGFHEVFHTCTVLAFACQWAGILVVAVNPPLV